MRAAGGKGLAHLRRGLYGVHGMLLAGQRLFKEHEHAIAGIIDRAPMISAG